MKSFLITSLLIAIAMPSFAWADDQTSPAPAPTSPTSDVSSGTSSNTGATGESNNREKTLEGSKSPFSLQFNMTYSGSSINHPFSADVPNPGNQVPPPLATLSGTFSGRYRIDDKTTVGLGAGLTTYTPFEGPKNTSVSDPYVDIARSYKLGPIHNRADFQNTLWTDNQNNSLGWRYGLTLTNEAFYEFPFGLTVGGLLEVDYNFFSGAAKYQGVIPPNVAANIGTSGTFQENQMKYDLYTDPYFEFALSDRVNLRSVIGIPWYHTESTVGFLKGQSVYQTLGVGVQVIQPWFIYVYVQAYPYQQLTSSSTTFGFNTIFNIL
jgi:hypothetical protein